MQDQRRRKTGEHSTASIIKVDPTTTESGMAEPTEASSDSIGRFHHRCVSFSLYHYLWIEDTGFLIHPTILNAYREFKDLRIAQIGIGNCMSMIYALRETKGRSIIDGYDVDISKAMPKEWYSPKLRIRPQDMSRPSLDSCPVKSYDLVHLRFAASLVRDNNPDTLISNAATMLKPGGWIQWDEFDPTSASVVTTNNQPTSLFPNAETLARLTREKGVETHGWLSRFPLHFIKHGLDFVDDLREPISVEHMTVSTEVLILALEEQMRLLRKDGDKEEKARSRVLEGALRGFEEESRRARRGVAISMDRYIGLARKEEGVRSGVKEWGTVEKGWVADDDGLTATKVVGGRRRR